MGGDVEAAERDDAVMVESEEQDGSHITNEIREIFDKWKWVSLRFMVINFLTFGSRSEKAALDVSKSEGNLTRQTRG